MMNENTKLQVAIDQCVEFQGGLFGLRVWFLLRWTKDDSIAPISNKLWTKVWQKFQWSVLYHRLTMILRSNRQRKTLFFFVNFHVLWLIELLLVILYPLSTLVFSSVKFLRFHVFITEGALYWWFMYVYQHVYTVFLAFVTQFVLVSYCESPLAYIYDFVSLPQQLRAPVCMPLNKSGDKKLFK
jgi:hypothetical protein